MGSGKYSKELKEEIILKVKGGRSAKEVAEEHGIKAKAVYDILRSGAEGKSAEILEVSKLRRENELLYKLIGRMTYEKEVKKRPH